MAERLICNCEYSTIRRVFRIRQKPHMEEGADHFMNHASFDARE